MQQFSDLISDSRRFRFYHILAVLCLENWLVPFAPCWAACAQIFGKGTNISLITALHREVELCETTGKGIKWLDERAYICSSACAPLDEHWRASRHAEKNLGWYLHQHHQSNSICISTSSWPDCSLEDCCLPALERYQALPLSKWVVSFTVIVLIFTWRLRWIKISDKSTF